MIAHQQRFETRFHITPGCWEWDAKADKDGYGWFCIGKEKLRAHRVSYQIYKGQTPGALHVLHKCDNPRCVNPEHLFLGTNVDNVKDKISKGRQMRGPGAMENRRSFKGELSPTAKLTQIQVDAIRQDGRLHRLIAADYGVCRATVSHIKRRLIWNH